MADLKITGLTALGATPADADILAIVDDVAGTPVTKKVTVANLMAAASGGDMTVLSAPGNGLPSGGATVSAGGLGYPVVRLNNGQTNNWYSTIKVPSGATSISSIKLYHYKNANSGNLYLRFYSYIVDISSVVAPPSDRTDTLTTYAVTGDVGDVDVITIPAAAYNALSFVEDDMFSLDVYRDANDATDTYNDGFDIMGIEINFA